ncbi:MAG: translesion error-prone DNA polymerase V autoproteolytic subunit [Verrucomicrobia bacterium]|nr:translesion error-prone DNA polymerase V autoproteolytic subunit [Verrucomicrobiota bacterium]
MEIFQAEVGEPLPLPLFHAKISAGFPSPAENDLDKALDLNQLMVTHPAATFFVRVVGDSMQGAGISSGDILVVDRSLEATHGKIVVAVVNGEFTVKRLRVEKEHICLVPENPAYPILHLQEGSDFQVWGVVTYVIHKAV